MSKLPIILMVCVLSGCVDLGRIGMHPDFKTAQFDGNQYQVSDCFYSAALNQHLSLMRDSPLPDGTKKYNLEDANYEAVAWVEIFEFNDKTGVNFFYAPNAPDVSSAISAMISQCQKSLN
ncbi:Uncharacterised protein [Serratia grimesii]|uniref:hypothetical protein n=2 Tax=Serratia grimesii TaxID=82995 RepID=UPI0021C4E10A|nr:hypothetical protein [Serratia grimesii]ULG12742.1 hypothetical protein 348p1_00105 [Serratia grimesii]CAI2793948.1 Uncharacterised protein [Serratia grimesii]